MSTGEPKLRSIYSQCFADWATFLTFECFFNFNKVHCRSFTSLVRFARFNSCIFNSILRLFWTNNQFSGEAPGWAGGRLPNSSSMKSKPKDRSLLRTTHKYCPPTLFTPNPPPPHLPHVKSSERSQVLRVREWGLDRQCIWAACLSLVASGLHKGLGNFSILMSSCKFLYPVLQQGLRDWGVSIA